MDACLNSDVAGVSLVDLVDELNFLNQASGGTRGTHHRSSNVRHTARAALRESADVPATAQPERKTITALVHAAPRDSAHSQPLEGLSNLVNKVASESTDRIVTTKDRSAGLVAKPKNKLKRKAPAVTCAKAKGPFDDVARDRHSGPQTSAQKKPRRSAKSM
ncbi:hypothetical protein R3I93_009456 [Phoxinus phoxinus]|uniref:Uncharacterized protein n=1 Tax=Phoxinus phoxinus TaxID=58324 RepID=A0AAN9D7J6_9TELE